MDVIADTNTFLAVVLDEPEKARIIRLSVGHDLVAPEILPFEVGNALSAMMKKRTLNPDEVIAAWEAVQAIPVELRRIDILAALRIAARFNIYAYDAYFIECASRLRCPLMTLDRRMIRVAQEAGISILEEKT